MFFQVSKTERKKAKTAHEVFMLNLVISHLFMAPASIALQIGVMGFLIPLVFSLSIIAFISWRSKQLANQSSWFVHTHWRLAAKRTRLLLIAYVISAGIIAIGFFVAANTDVKTTQDIMLTIFSRLAVVPVLIMVMICFVLESGSIYQTTRGEVPDNCIKHFPAPEELQSSIEILIDQKED